MKDNRITPAQVKVSASKSYTLAELTTLAKQFVAEYPSRGDSEWMMSLWLAWLEKQEKEANG